MFVSALVGQIATIVGLMAGGIAVGGFIGHARPSLLGKPEQELRQMTTIGGLVGLASAVSVVILSVALQ
jgi:hypothetical protein